MINLVNDCLNALVDFQTAVQGFLRWKDKLIENNDNMFTAILFFSRLQQRTAHMALCVTDLAWNFNIPDEWIMRQDAVQNLEAEFMRRQKLFAIALNLLDDALENLVSQKNRRIIFLWEHIVKKKRAKKVKPSKKTKE